MQWLASHQERGAMSGQRLHPYVRRATIGDDWRVAERITRNDTSPVMSEFEFEKEREEFDPCRPPKKETEPGDCPTGTIGSILCRSPPPWCDLCLSWPELLLSAICGIPDRVARTYRP